MFFKLLHLSKHLISFGMTIAHPVFFTIAVILVLSKLTQILSYARAFFGRIISYKADLGARYGKNSWALITGASSGLGKSFAFQLAAQGFNLVLVVRNQEKTEEVVKELKAQHPSVQTKIVLANFENAYEDGFAEKIFGQVKDLDISFVVNNAGGWVTRPLVEQSYKDVQDIVVIDALGPALITRVFLPKLAERKRSALINVSSGAADYPLTKVQVYSAAKVFVDHLTRGLIDENPNVDILSLRPYFVATKMTEKSPGLDVVKPDDCVKSALRSLGHTDYTYGHWKHSISGFMLAKMPSYIRRNMTRSRV